ncbi:MAG TPA: c-type cytochrome [Gemmatimonadales bacterium]
MIMGAMTPAVMSVMLVMVMGCGGGGRGFFLPGGDVAAGKEAVQAMQCFVCHEIVGSDFPAPHAQPLVMVSLGAEKARQSRERLAESIIAPSHRVPEGVASLTSAGLSRMGDYSEVMTVRQLIDIVAYLQSVGR